MMTPSPTPPILHDVSDDDEVKDWSAIYVSDENSESDTEDELEQQWTLGGHLYSVTMLADSYIPGEGVDRKYANGVQRSLIDFWTHVDKADRATKKPKFKLPNLC